MFNLQQFVVENRTEIHGMVQEAPTVDDFLIAFREKYGLREIEDSSILSAVFAMELDYYSGTA